jgi:hypothetical protein
VAVVEIVEAQQAAQLLAEVVAVVQRQELGLLIQLGLE